MTATTTAHNPATATRRVEPCGSGDIQWVDLELSPETTEQLIRSLVETLRRAPRLAALITAQVIGERTLDDPKSVVIRRDLAASMESRGHTSVHLTSQQADTLADDLAYAARAMHEPDPCANVRCPHLAMPGSEFCADHDEVA